MEKRPLYAMLHTAALMLLGLSLLTLPGPLVAQSYSFSVPVMKMEVFVRPDASVRIVYNITFENYGQAIDIVDIGLPHENYDLTNMRASIDGHTLTEIYPSEYVDPGVEIHLNQYAIPSGGRGTLHFECVMPDLVYQDTTNKEYASLQITPTWFDAQFVEGTGDLWLAVHMLEGIRAEEVLYQKTPFTNKVLYQGHVAAIWHWEDASITGPHLVGVSFPKRGMERVVEMTIFQLVRKFMEDNPTVRFALAALALGGFALLFFRFSGGTGCSVFVILAGGLLFLFIIAPAMPLYVLPLLVALIALNERNLRRRRQHYLPPIAQVEGGGIKRGLTAPEAAVLLELPLSKVLALVIFGLLEKGVLEQVKDDPLTVRVAAPYRTIERGLRSFRARRDARRRAAQKLGTVIHSYEDYFLDVIEAHPDKPVEALNFTAAMESLINQTARRMKGFDLEQTRAYYRRVIERALDQAAALGDIEARETFLDKYLPWVLMHENYPTVFTHGGYTYWPRWVRHTYAPATTGGGGKLAAPSPSRPAVGGRTTFGDVAASFAGWAETTMGKMASTITPSLMKSVNVHGGLVDLSGVDRVTGDIFEALVTSSGSGGGGGGSCACACAGCACACACAGGGR